MIPIDNSLAGRVSDIHHFLPTSPLHIVAEHFLRIRFALLGVPGATGSTTSAPCTATCTRWASADGSSASTASSPVISGDTAGAAREVQEAGRPDPGRDLAAAGRRDLRPGGAARGRRGRGPQHHEVRGALARLRPGAARQRPGRDQLRVQRAQPPGRALQGARRLRHQRREHDQARELHGRRGVHRDPVPRRGRRPPRGPPRRARAGGAGVLHHRGEGARRLPRRPVPTTESGRPG